MTDFSDHFEDMAEETDEFEAAFEERLEEIFGFEFEVQNVTHQQHNRVNVHVQPAGAREKLNEELEDARVENTGTMSFNFRRQD